MSTKIFVNLAVIDLKESMEFFRKLGFTFNAQFTDENAASLVISEHIYAMLLVEKFFKTFTKKEICDTSKSIEAMIGLSVESKEKVDDLFSKAINAGGKEARATQDLGFMYARSFEDLDGHTWEIIWMDQNTVNKS